MQRLRLLGCDLMQGNRVGQAATADDFAARAKTLTKG
jgi:EAL domain-containing protein (putative c-di-GMP-specific phosphodiesterase class I)